MTLDDLEKVYLSAFRIALEGPYNGQKAQKSIQAGIAAVVRALRDEMQSATQEYASPECCGRGINTYTSPPECCGDPNYRMNTDDVLNVFNEILGSDAGAAGESANTVDAQQCQTTTTSSATPILAGSSTSNPEGKKTCLVATPATSFCEWKGVRDSFDYQRGCGGFDEGDPDIGDPCPSCGKPIRFTEESK